MELLDIVALWIGRVVLIASGAAATVWLITKPCDYTYTHGITTAEFLHWAVARKILRRRKKKWKQWFPYAPQSDPDHEDYIPPGYKPPTPRQDD